MIFSGLIKPAYFVTIFITLVSICPKVGWTAQDNSANPAPSLHKYALVVGNAVYANAPQLANAANDANDMCATLRSLNFDVTCKINVASKRAFKEILYEFTGKLNKSSVALFYFAGHGVEVDNVNYLIPTKAALQTKSDIDDESVQLNYVMREFNLRNTALNVFLLDACRDNPFLNPLRDYVSKLGFATQMDIPSNSVLAVSTGANQVASDGNGKNGLFTKNVLHALSIPKLSLSEMIQTAMEGTMADAKRLGMTQAPVATYSYNGKFCLNGCGDSVTEAAALAKEQEEILSKRRELASLEKSIAEAKAKQAEIDAQKQALIQKQAEITRLQETVSMSQAARKNTQVDQDALVEKQKEADTIAKNLNTATAALAQLEDKKNMLLKRQIEVNQIQERLDAQERSIQSKSDKISKDKDKKYEPVITPSF